jgi:hypothetical protein
VEALSGPGDVRAPRRTRTATESLLSIVLGLEAVLTFFLTVTAFGLKVAPPAVVFGGGAALFVLLLCAAWLTRYRVGVWLGWVLQAVLIAAGFVLALMFFIGAGFTAIWIYCFVTGRRLDARNAASDSPTADPRPKEPS